MDIILYLFIYTAEKDYSGVFLSLFLFFNRIETVNEKNLKL